MLSSYLNEAFSIVETEHVSLSHLQLAQSMREEAKKLEDFRERQKEARKKVCSYIRTVIHRHNVNAGDLDVPLSLQIEQNMDALHKQRAAQFKKTMEASDLLTWHVFCTQHINV